MNAIDNELSPLRIPDLEDELTAVLCAAISWGGSVISSEEYVAAKQRFRAAVNAAIEADRKRRGEPVLVGWAVGTTGGGLLHASKYTEYEARRAGYSLPLYRLTATQPAAQSDAEVAETCRAMGANSFAEFFGKTAPQPAEPDLAKCAECGAEMIHVRPGKWQHPDCPQSPRAAEPVKGQSDDVLADADRATALEAENVKLREALEIMVEMVEMNGFGRAYAMNVARAALAQGEV